MYGQRIYTISHDDFSSYGKIYLTLVPANAVSMIGNSAQLKTMNISEVIFIENYRTYDRCKTNILKYNYLDMGCKPKTFILVTRPPSEKFKYSYAYNSSYALAKLIDFIFKRIILGENVLLDINANRSYKYLIVAALSVRQDKDTDYKQRVHRNHRDILKGMEYLKYLPPAKKIDKSPLLIPIELKGKVYRYVMPQNILFDEGAYLQTLKDADIDTILILSEREELVLGSSTDLITLYIEEGLKVECLPLPEGELPTIKQLIEIVRKLEALSNDGRNIVIHCWAGNGRTGLVLACFVKHMRKCSGQEATDFIIKLIPKSLESEKEWALVDKFSIKN